MSDPLLDMLQLALASHGIDCELRGAAIHAQDGLVIEPQAFPRETVNGTAQVQVDFVIGSPRLNGLSLLDSFAGVGDTSENAQKNAFGKFLQGSFHVVAEALTSHTCEVPQVEWEEWQGEGHVWRACVGPLLLLATREGARIDGMNDFFPQLNTLFQKSMGPGPHWMRIFLGSLDGKYMGSEVLVDGEYWPAGQQLLEAHAWTYPDGYASFRHLLIALPQQ